MTLGDLDLSIGDRVTNGLGNGFTIVDFTDARIVSWPGFWCDKGPSIQVKTIGSGHTYWIDLPSWYGNVSPYYSWNKY